MISVQEGTVVNGYHTAWYALSNFEGSDGSGIQKLLWNFQSHYCESKIMICTYICSDFFKGQVLTISNENHYLIKNPIEKKTKKNLTELNICLFYLNYVKSIDILVLEKRIYTLWCMWGTSSHFRILEQ